MAKHRTPRIVTGDGGAWKVYGGAAVAAVILAVLITASLDRVRSDGPAVIEGLRADKIMLLGQLSEFEAENSSLREEVARLDRIRQIDQEARRQLLEDFGAAQAELEDLRRRVALFEAVLNQEEGKAGIKVHSFTVEAGPGANEYVYELVLTKIGENSEVISGAVDFAVDGIRDGKPATLGLSDLSGAGGRSVVYELKYFQVLEGTLVLPDGFTPREIEVQTAPSKDPKKPGATRRFPWPRPAS